MKKIKRMKHREGEGIRPEGGEGEGGYEIKQRRGKGKEDEWKKIEGKGCEDEDRIKNEPT